MKNTHVSMLNFMARPSRLRFNVVLVIEHRVADLTLPLALSPRAWGSFVLSRMWHFMQNGLSFSSTTLKHKGGSKKRPFLLTCLFWQGPRFFVYKFEVIRFQVRSARYPIVSLQVNRM